MRSRWFLLIDAGLLILMAGNVWLGSLLYELLADVKTVRGGIMNPIHIPPAITMTLPSDIGFVVQSGRSEGEQIIWTTISPAGVERATFLPAGKGGEYSQTFTVPRCDTLCITMVRRNPLTP